MKKQMDSITIGVLLRQLRTIKEEYLSKPDIPEWEALNWTNLLYKTKSEILSYVISEEDSVIVYESGTEKEFMGLTEEYMILSDVVLEKLIKGEYSIEKTQAILHIWETFKNEFILYFYDNFLENSQLSIT